MFLLQATAITNDIVSSPASVPFFSSPFVLKVYYFFKIILIVYSGVLLFAIVLIVASVKPKKAVKEVKASIESIIGTEKEEKVKITASGWKEISKLVDSGEESSWRLAIIEADKFFDEVLRRLGYSGENFSERLAQVHPSDIENINDVWNAHRVRNSLSHDVNFKLSEGEAKKAVAAYERAMKDLEVI